MSKKAQNMFNQGITEQSIQQWEEYLLQNGMQQIEIEKAIQPLQQFMQQTQQTQQVQQPTQPMQPQKPMNISKKIRVTLKK